MTSGSEAVLFWILAPITVAGALGLLFARKAVYAALGIALAMVNLGVLYLALGAPFLGVVQVVVYTGAVMMLFLFVLMLVGVDSSDSIVETIKGQRVVSLALGLGLVGLLGSVIGQVSVGALPGEPKSVADNGHINAMADLIFGKYVWVFEITSALPAPGVYARHNAVDTPALLPDGTASELSISRVLAARDQIEAPQGYAEISREMEQEITEGSTR